MRRFLALLLGFTWVQACDGAHDDPSCEGFPGNIASGMYDIVGMDSVSLWVEESWVEVHLWGGGEHQVFHYDVVAALPAD
jgi:hypothetical protein